MEPWESLIFIETYGKNLMTFFYHGISHVAKNFFCSAFGIHDSKSKILIGVLIEVKVLLCVNFSNARS